MELTHDALIDHWELLRAWLREDRSLLRVRQRLSDATREWLVGEYDSSYLYREKLLTQAEAWANEHSQEMTDPEWAFLDASLALRTREEAERDAQRQRELDAAHRLTEEAQAHARQQAGTARRLRWGAVLLSVLSIIAALLAVFALQASKSANLAARQAEAASELAVARQLAAQAVASGERWQDPEIGLLLALEGVRLGHENGLSQSAELTDALRRALGAAPRSISRHDGRVIYTAFSPDGARLASSSDDGKVQVMDTATGQQVSAFDNGTVAAPLFSRTGSRLLMVDSDYAFKLWDPSSGQPLPTATPAPTPSNGRQPVAFAAVPSSSSDEMALVGADGTIWLRTPNGGERVIAHVDAGVSKLVVSPTRLLVLGPGDMARLLDLMGTTIARLRHDPAASWTPSFSMDGAYLATSGDPQEVLTWDATTGKPLAILRHVDTPAALAEVKVGGDIESSITEVTFGPRGARLTYVTSIGSVHLWDIIDGRELTVASYGSGDQWGNKAQGQVSFSPDGLRLMVIGENPDTQVQLFDTVDGREIVTLVVTGALDRNAFNLDSTRLGIASRDDMPSWGSGPYRILSIVQLIDTRTGNILYKRRHFGPTWKLVFSPDGKRMITANDDGTVRVVDAASGRELASLIHSAQVLSVSFSQDGRYLATGSGDGTARVWDMTLDHEPIVFRHEEAAVQRMIFTPDGTRLATIANDGTVHLFGTLDRQELAVLRVTGQVQAARFSPDGTRLAALGENGDVALVDAQTGREVISVQYNTQRGWDLDFSPHSTQLAVGASMEVHVLDAVTGRELASLRQKAEISSVKYGIDESQLAVGTAETAIHIWNPNTKQDILTLQTRDLGPLMVFTPWKLAFTSDGMHLASAGDSLAGLWDLTDGGKELAVVPVYQYPPPGMYRTADIALSPDGTRLATTSVDGMAHIVDVASGRELSQLHHAKAFFDQTGGYVVAVRDVEYSPDGKYLATASDDATAVLWETATDKELTQLHFGDAATSVAFSPDSRLMAAASVDGTARLVDVATGSEIAVLHHEGAINQVVFSPDGVYVTTAGVDGTVRLWRARVDDLVTEGCRVLSRNMTTTEWQNYLGSRPYRKTCENLPMPSPTPTPDWPNTSSLLTSPLSPFVSPIQQP